MNLLQLNTSVEKLRFLQDYNVPARDVFSFFSDHNRWSEVYPAIIRRLTDSVDPRNANGLGSSRIIAMFPTIFQETITKYEEGNLIEYKITFGSPFKNYVGNMRFVDLGNGKSRLDYSIEFEPRIPKTGFILRNLVEKRVGDAIRELANRFDKNPNY